MLTPISPDSFKAASDEASRIIAESQMLERFAPSFGPGSDPAFDTPLPDMVAFPCFQRCSDHLLSL